MLIITARVAAATSLSDACHEAIDLFNRLEVGIDLSFEDRTIEARPGGYPYNLIRQHERIAGKSS